MRVTKRHLRILIILWVSNFSLPAMGQTIDPLTARVELEDAERFALLFEDFDGAPTAEQLQNRYLEFGGRALEIFTPGRIISAQNLAAKIAENPDTYRDAIERCLPIIRQTEDELRSIYLAFRGLLPEQSLPRIAVVFGGLNSGGTAESDMQVLGLEVLCSIAADEAAFRAIMRTFYAHETVHTFQRFGGPKVDADPMLTAAINEGTADYLAALVTGTVPDPSRDDWASANRHFVLQEFTRDLAKVRDAGLDADLRNAAFFRWFANAGSSPEGWPSELGYWVGMQISKGYVENAPDRRAAIRELLAFNDPAEILARSGVELPVLTASNP
ncbi:hypothetical protein [uncultured Erythrobacter sp.]|uniref:gliding motility protein GldB-related protein n=1 Tax=uncultured Erythrobacter sp. TaxID=263913 RepID=UPI002607EE42|nr:hypothetical protein [uncultured Erythrobacter sp.]